MLENLYKESDENADRRRRRIALIFFAVAAYLGAAYIYYLVREAETERRIAAESREKYADAWCGKIRLPPGFVLLERGETIDDGDTTTVVYKYRAYTNFEAKSFYRSYFLEQFRTARWRATGDRPLVFERSEQKVALIEDENDPLNYELRCSETAISFGI